MIVSYYKTSKVFYFLEEFLVDKEGEIFEDRIRG